MLQLHLALLDELGEQGIEAFRNLDMRRVASLTSLFDLRKVPGGVSSAVELLYGERQRV